MIDAAEATRQVEILQDFDLLIEERQDQVIQVAGNNGQSQRNYPGTPM